MRQTLHIFKKDIRHLWFEIVVVVSVVAGFTFTGARQALWLVDPGTNRLAAGLLLMFLLPLAWWTLIARVIHSEALPGDRQFWTTRPYAWMSLVGAKALFILAFINLPKLVADAVIVHAYGLPLRAELSGLLWSQILLTAAFILPIAALSALTTGFVQLIFVILALCMIALVATIVAPEAVLGGVFGGLGWVRSYYAFVVIAIATLAILILQYSRRRTTAARSLAVAAGILAVVGMALIPWSAAFRIQSWFSKERLDQSLVHVDFDSGGKWLIRAAAGKDDRVRVALPLQIRGLPPGMSARLEGFAVSLQAPDGTMWKADQHSLNYEGSTIKMGQEFSVQVTVDASFYGKVKDEPLKIRGLLYLTLVGNRQTVDVPFGDRAVPVPGVGVCSATPVANGKTYFLICSSAFRSPPVLMSWHFIEITKDSVEEAGSYSNPRLISYSPFPADLGINPVSQDLQHFTLSTAHVPVAEARVETLEPLAYIWRDFEIDNLRLGDFEAQTAPGSH